ncbi:hypothetical protein HL653_07565 [Sphingomonas sp. AP4-R1]|uniref:hypothetical protein n=1 Tax=Sphingomonas sp. AP4-R1 TaxID=2735134 RepID=UPI001493AB90|nr:hypothetical protein [Sphingomonas sp. AP4-R1]QJU57665.1 hypothetical protein HL653_07565 [Sphingomonas sp. AP4-R1]
MTRASHWLVRGTAFVAAAAAVFGLLGHRPRTVVPPAPTVTLGVAQAGPVSEHPSEPLFAEPPIDALPAATRGPPALLGIVGRLSDPLVMARAKDGAVRTIGRGQAIDGWTLESVGADRATFRRGAEARVAVLPPRDEAP